MTHAVDRAILWSDRLGLPRLFFGSPERKLTTILFHDFRIGGESRDASRERVRRQCDYLATRYTPVTAGTALEVLDGTRPDLRYPLLVTVDDAKRDILDVIDIFDAAGIPVLQFICAGWTSQASGVPDEPHLLPRIVTTLHFYRGQADWIRFGGTEHLLNHDGNAGLIDALLATGEQAARTQGWERLVQLDADNTPPARICAWDELRDLQAGGMTIGCHSVSHPPIARCSTVRQDFEITAAKALVEAELGPTRYFAYPFGIPKSHDAGTRTLLSRAGFEAGFTTEQIFAPPGTDRLVLPRITLPDIALDDAQFQARIRGGCIPLAYLKERLR